MQLYAWGNSSNVKKLQVLQNSALRHITGAVKTTPIASLHILTGSMLMETIRQHASEISSLRLMSRSQSLREMVERLMTNPTPLDVTCKE